MHSVSDESIFVVWVYTVSMKTILNCTVLVYVFTLSGWLKIELNGE